MAEEKPTDTEKAGATDSKSGEFAIHKIYVKDISFETPHTPSIFSEEWNPSVNMQLGSEAVHINDSQVEVILTVTVTTTIGEKTAYLVEVHVAGIFHIRDFPRQAIEHMAATVCPNILFPFARELVCDLITRGGFPQLLLAPVNFEALYAQQQQEARAAKSTGQPAAEEGTKH